MTSETAEQNSDNAFIRFGNGLISFIVGLSAFFVIKLAFMIPLNLMATSNNIKLMESIGALLIFLSIYLAVKYTKKLNKNGTKKSRNIKRIITILLGMVCMLVTTMFSVITKSI